MSPYTGLLLLSQSISKGAMHDSGERYPAGKCHPGTREEVLADILKWINDPFPQTEVLWLWGSAGAGKSAIMQTIAEILLELYRERYAASFFFARGVPKRAQGGLLFSTLAYQIALHVPGMRECIDRAMVIDPTLPSKSMDIQLQSLIVHPLSQCPHLPVHTPTIIIDGLDECHDSDVQHTILSLIAKALTVSRIPVRFLIASRPEYWIREIFDGVPLVDITQRISLSNSRNVDKDIRKFLEEEFEKIYAKNASIMSHVLKPWPSSTVMNRLVYNASGQFIYASTVLKF
ncbi:hypothetical protein GALMADRAFT_65493, partial [Galerina marginata CBS 339.88]